MTTNRGTQRWILILTSLGSFLVVLDMLVVATALTTIHRDLGASMADLEWTVNAYTLSFAVLLMSAAALGDRFGRRGGYVAGLAACALSSNVGMRSRRAPERWPTASGNAPWSSPDCSCRSRA
jgi:MFS family permease